MAVRGVGRNVQKARQIDLVKASTKELKSYIANEGKRLNQQIVTIEKNAGLAKSSFAYKYLTEKPQFSQYLGVNKSGRTKIELSTRGKSRQELQQLAGVINKFITMETMTKKGIKNYYGRVFDSLRRKYPGLEKLSDEQLADILTTEGFESAKGFDGSDRIFTKIGEAKDANTMIKYLEKRNTFETVISADQYFKQINANVVDKGNPSDYN